MVSVPSIAQHIISTHAPAGGATRASSLPSCGRTNFYSRPCGRGDRFGASHPTFLDISTHAPAGGATRSWPPRL